jgi:hypothetical protein
MTQIDVTDRELNLLIRGLGWYFSENMSEESEDGKEVLSFQKRLQEIYGKDRNVYE